MRHYRQVALPMTAHDGPCSAEHAPLRIDGAFPPPHTDLGFREKAVGDVLEFKWRQEPGRAAVVLAEGGVDPDSTPDRSR